MNPIAPSQLLESLNWRYATKQFDPTKKIDTATWEALENALILSPSSYGLQPWKFFVVTDPAIREQLKAHSWNQPQVTDSSHHVVFAIRTQIDAAFVDSFLRRTVEVRGGTLEALDFYRKMIVSDVIEGPRSKWSHEWAARQAYIALGNFMTAAALLGVDACPMEGIDPAKYDEILGLKEKGFHTVVACPAGYRLDSDKYASLPKVRFAKSDVIEHV